MARIHNKHSFIEISRFPFLCDTRDESLKQLTLERGTSLSCLAIDHDSRFLNKMMGYLNGTVKSEGAIRVDQDALGQCKPGYRGVACVSYDSPLFSHFDVAQNIYLPLQVQGGTSREEWVKRGRGLQALLGLEKIWHHYPQHLSVMMEFRVKLARALIQKPAFVIFNQVTRSMTDEVAREVITFLDRLKRSAALSYLFLTTRYRCAFMASSKTAIFSRGCLRQVGTTTSLLDRPASAEIARALSGSNCLTASVVAIEDDIALLHLPCGGKVEAMASETLKKDKLACVCISPQRISLLRRTDSSGDEGQDGVLPAVVSSYFHLGDVIIINVRLLDGTEVSVQRSPSMQKKSLVPGDAMSIAWGAQNAQAFPL